MSAPAFVTVDTVGRPCGHETAAGAIETHLRDIGGSWNLFGHTRPGVESALDRDGQYLFFRHVDGASPVAAGVFRNFTGIPLGGFTNWHLQGLPKSREYLDAARAAWIKRKGPRVGDYVRDTGGALSRFTNDTGAGLQAGGGRGSYWIGTGGGASYSGGLTSSIPRDRLTDTGETLPGEFWFFLDGWTGAHRGISVQIPCRVYQEESAA